MPGHRKPLPTASCIFTSDWWNDSEQRNYILYECKNPKNTGGNSNIPLVIFMVQEHIAVGMIMQE